MTSHLFMQKFCIGVVADLRVGLEDPGDRVRVSLRVGDFSDYVTLAPEEARELSRLLDDPPSEEEEVRGLYVVDDKDPEYGGVTLTMDGVELDLDDGKVLGLTRALIAAAMEAEGRE